MNGTHHWMIIRQFDITFSSTLSSQMDFWIESQDSILCRFVDCFLTSIITSLCASLSEKVDRASLSQFVASLQILPQTHQTQAAISFSIKQPPILSSSEPSQPYSAPSPRQVTFSIPLPSEIGLSLQSVNNDTLTFSASDSILDVGCSNVNTLMTSRITRLVNILTHLPSLSFPSLCICVDTINRHIIHPKGHHSDQLSLIELISLHNPLLISFTFLLQSLVHSLHLHPPLVLLLDTSLRQLLETPSHSHSLMLSILIILRTLHSQNQDMSLSQLLPQGTSSSDLLTSPIDAVSLILHLHEMFSFLATPIDHSLSQMSPHHCWQLLITFAPFLLISTLPHIRGSEDEWLSMRQKWREIPQNLHRLSARRNFDLVSIESAISIASNFSWSQSQTHSPIDTIAVVLLVLPFCYPSQIQTLYSKISANEASHHRKLEPFFMTALAAIPDTMQSWILQQNVNATTSQHSQATQPRPR
ncbi:hypothetical protein BLNAU_10361 [Blattamonas nauphoetae]|uniref:Uncharacterized protein n=1 Tax=Blattamonas nauphoetae TaxID=2049346 RepID=A0ABQ9XT94_9EUKA|nr:hypothetical protein BLNAU_10361 [Blattamonas nauphoetae]